MQKLFKVSLLSPEKPIGEFQSALIELPGEMGNLGVGANHVDFVGQLKTGLLHFVADEQGEVAYNYYIGGGLFSVRDNEVQVFATQFEVAVGIDTERAQKALERANNRLKDSKNSLDIPRALAALERARARLQLKNTHRP